MEGGIEGQEDGEAQDSEGGDEEASVSTGEGDSKGGSEEGVEGSDEGDDDDDEEEEESAGESEEEEGASACSYWDNAAHTDVLLAWKQAAEQLAHAVICGCWHVGACLEVSCSASHVLLLESKLQHKTRANA
eukprot:1139067-Pelagomonas_calceolata.AAC.3